MPLVDSHEVREWGAAYGSGWENSDAEAVAELFTPECSYRSSIFADAHLGQNGVRDYWRRATGSQSNVTVNMGEPIVDGDRVAMEWWTGMHDADDGDITLPGVLLLEFGAAGRCRTLHEYYNITSGRREPFEGWGRKQPGDVKATRVAAHAWADAWERAWRLHRADEVLGFYSPDVRFRSQVFRDVLYGREGVRGYMEWAFASERDPQPQFGRPRAEGATAAVEYWTTAIDAESSDDSSMTIAGCSLLTIDPDGRVLEQHDYWHQSPGRRSPPPEWGH